MSQDVVAQTESAWVADGPLCSGVCHTSSARFEIFEGPGGAFRFLGTSKSDSADFVCLFFQIVTDFDGF